MGWFQGTALAKMKIEASQISARAQTAPKRSNSPQRFVDDDFIIRNEKSPKA